MKICIAGKNNIAVEIAEFLTMECCVKKEDIIIVLNKNDNFCDKWQRSLGKYARENRLKIVTLEEVYGVEDLLFLSLEYDRIIRPHKFKTLRLYNIHFSLLPKYKGMYTAILPILHNEECTGVTLHKIDKGIDTGNIIDQMKFKIENNDNSRDIYFKNLDAGALLIKKHVTSLIKNEFVICHKQAWLGSSYYSKDALNFNKIEVDLNQTAITIHNQIRAFNFREYQQPIVLNTKIISSKILSTNSNRKPGTVIFENDISLLIGTIDNDIVLYKDKSDDLFEACLNGNYELVEKYVQIPKIVNVQNGKGWTPLIVAIYHDNIHVVKILLINGADINIINYKGTTPLMYAKSAYVKHNNEVILRLILSLNANVRQKDYMGKTVMDYCIENEELSALRIIKEYMI